MLAKQNACQVSWLQRFRPLRVAGLPVPITNLTEATPIWREHGKQSQIPQKLAAPGRVGAAARPRVIRPLGHALDLRKAVSACQIRAEERRFWAAQTSLTLLEIKATSMQGGDMSKVWTFFRRYPVVAAALLVLVAGLILFFNGFPTASRVLVSVFAGAFAAWTAAGMIRDVLAGHFGLDILALLAIISTLIVGEYWASIIVVLMLSGGEALEDYAEQRAQKELTSLLDRTPTVAYLVRGDESTEIPVEDVQVGDTLLVFPGATVPVDCELIGPEASFDESSITGESLPVTVSPGEEVPSGAINGSQAVHVRAVKRSADSQYQMIVRLVQESQESKAPVVRLADRFAVPFTIVALAIGGIAWFVSKDPVRFVEVLVLATPCPLLIAAPVAFMGGMSRAAKSGIIVKGGAALEQSAKVRSVAMDKTGTLTDGQPVLAYVDPQPGVSKDELLQLAASAEQYSGHVLASGIRAGAAAANLALVPGEGVAEETGQGVTATLLGKSVRVGRLSYIAEVAPTATRATLQPGHVAVYVSANDRYLGCVVLADHIRDESAAVVKWLHDHGVDNVVMVTGDGPGTAGEVASTLGIGSVHASLRPADKVAIVKDLEPKPTLMVGDGVNDAPVLAAANVGVAMGARGSTAAGEAADVVILKDSLAQLPALIGISRDTVRVALTAIWLGIILSVVLMLIATTGFIPAVIGALLQEVLDLIAILYALRALTGKDTKLVESKVDSARLETAS